MNKTVIALFCCLVLSAASVVGQNAEPVKLFEQQDLSQWRFHVAKEGVDVKDVFTFSGDVLTSTGQPFGYLATKEKYRNFKLTVEYRWPDGATPTNSGIFLRMTEQPPKSFLSKCFEVQLAHGDAGDLWGFHGRRLPAPPQVTGERIVFKNGGDIAGEQSGVKRFVGAENEPGQWNAIEILCSEGLIVIVMNGKIVNWATDAEIIDGNIGFQSEGGPVEFRNALLTVLP